MRKDTEMDNAYIDITVIVSDNKYMSLSSNRAERNITFNVPLDAAYDIDYGSIIRRMVSQAELEFDETPALKDEATDE